MESVSELLQLKALEWLNLPDATKIPPLGEYTAEYRLEVAKVLAWLALAAAIRERPKSLTLEF